MQSKIRAEAERCLEEWPELMVGDHVQLQNLRGKHPLKSDQNGVFTSKYCFNSYSGRISGSGLITNCNRPALCKILPTVQNNSLVFGQGQGAAQRADGAQPGQGTVQRPDRAQPGQGTVQRPDRAQPGGQRPDMTGPASPDHSPAVGGAGGGHPEELSRLTGSPGVAKRIGKEQEQV